METNRIASKLRDLKAKHKFWNIKGRGTNVWYIDEFNHEEDLLDPQTFDEDEI